jgi:hypothetical protein
MNFTPVDAAGIAAALLGVRWATGMHPKLKKLRMAGCVAVLAAFAFGRMQHGGL